MKRYQNDFEMASHTLYNSHRNKEYGDLKERLDSEFNLQTGAAQDTPHLLEDVESHHHNEQAAASQKCDDIVNSNMNDLQLSLYRALESQVL
jgi:hypothetical protein